ncbi:DUF4132 domain-containing protein [Bacillus sp. MRMR6]|uniref:DUF4132 domain-containing protein n=1 Tax=Bacillus sp. MRMR6 TaxID=1928617 RepID=UPI0009515C0F|nr:DUF4132 domain-containing protein [Bacillus sp. MRMR6]OLS39247.1 hypothetical protein BTR25_12650 [Bacillus sp. MRMR6]
MYYYYQDSEAIKKYIEKLNVKTILSFGRNKDIINAIVACHKIKGYNYEEWNKKQANLYSTLWTENTESISVIFSGSEFKVLVTLFGREWAEKFKKVWDNSSEYIYSSGMERRSFRTKSFDVLYLATAIEKLNGMLHLVAVNFSYEEYFASKDNKFAFNPVLPDLLALEIDENNEMVINQIQDIIYGDNNTGLVSREMIKGLLMSRSEHAHKMISELLLAAKLQEGLRQTIVECMDEGSREGFLYLLKTIVDHNLIRFSSVVRAFDVWTGLGITAQKPSVIKRCLETAYRCLKERDFAEECLKSKDALLIYIGLWSLAFNDVAWTETKIQELIAEEEKYKRLVALYFLQQVQYPRFQHKYALLLLDDPDYEVKSWVLKNLYSDINHLYNLMDNREDNKKYQRIDGICSSSELFEKLKQMLDHMPKKEKIFKESIFPWCETTVSCDEILVKMMLTASEPTDSQIDVLLDYKDKMSVNTRSAFIEVYLPEPKTLKQKTAMIEFMGDKSSQIRSTALKKVKKLPLTPEDYKIIENLLQYKAGDLRKNAISMLLKQSQEELLGSIKRLFDDKSENKHLAALDIISAIEKDPKYKLIVDECRQMAAVLSESSQQTKILVEKITQTKTEDFTASEGFGLYQPKQTLTLPELSPPSGFTSKDILSSSLEEIKQTLQTFSDLVDQYKEYEYEVEDWSGARQKVILGGEYSIRAIGNRESRDTLRTLEDYPLTEVWREASDKHKLSTTKLLEILFYFDLNQQYYRTNKEWYKKLLAQLFPNHQNEFKSLIKDLSYSYHVHTILQAMLNEVANTEIFGLTRNMVSFISQKVPKKCFAMEYENRNKTDYYYSDYSDTLVNAPEISFWYSTMKASSNDNDEQQFRDVFLLGYAMYKDSGYLSHTCLELADFEKAYEIGLVDENELYAELCGRPLSPENLRLLTNHEFHNHKSVSSCKKLNEVCRSVVDRVVSIELKRGDMTTEVSRLASRIYRCTGTKFFVDIVVASEKDTYVRGYNFVGDDSTKKEIFSHLLKNCYPADGEDENTLKELLAKRKVTEKQLIDAAMYSLQWFDMIEKYLNWPGLKSAGWYFHAHVNEYFSHEKESIVARYSPIPPEDLKSGAFDIDWFKEADSLLGAKRFKVVYNSAKYIAGGGLHKRSQLFTDAMLGKITSDQAEKIITEKRNKDYVLLYGLIPLGTEKKEMLYRYELLHQFLKESKQFGAQRRASEAKAVAISLENLARNAGFPDTNRFTWYMETEKIKSFQPYLKPAAIGDVDISIKIDELGRATVEVMKNGKPSKRIPSKLKNNEYVTEIKAVHKSLKAQYTRAWSMLEKAMEAGDEFTAVELANLSEHPVIYPLVKNLVFKSGNNLGYFKDGALVGTEKQSLPIQPEDTCIIAHPVHLYENRVWSAFQQDIFECGIIQPFKQVFRELYKPTADELEARTISSRYDGHQIQPKKAAALLKSRGWTVSYGEGLQKVFYKENMIAHIFAMADWYSPADVEAPTIEGVQFTERNTGKGIPFTEVPNVIFSEIMRDVDLVVSVAHVGGVDPEASLSTVEMRTAIMTELVRLLKLTNVELKGSHALITGMFGKYTVHLGSGVVHKMASGAVNILPIHSQHRGRLFLPFIDDDPKTAEITSKIVLLAEDYKIKDPTILVQIADGVTK